MKSHMLWPLAENKWSIIYKADKRMKKKFQTLKKNEKDSREWGNGLRELGWCVSREKWRGNGAEEKVTSQGWPRHVYKVNLTSEHWLDQERRGGEFMKERRKLLMKGFQFQDKFPCLFWRQLKASEALEGRGGKWIYLMQLLKSLVQMQMQWVFHHFVIMLRVTQIHGETGS